MLQQIIGFLPFLIQMLDLVNNKAKHLNLVLLILIINNQDNRELLYDKIMPSNRIILELHLCFLVARDDKEHHQV